MNVFRDREESQPTTLSMSEINVEEFGGARILRRVVLLHFYIYSI